MKLTKQEINYIDNYLIKNEVKFWDVRLELLDHIVSAIEDKMQKQGVSFNEALLEVHCGFGNQFIEFGIPKKEIFKKGLYQSNIGFKKFIRNKQKEIGKKNRKRFWRVLKQMLPSFKFLVEYALYIVIIYGCYLYKPKVAAILALVSLLIPELYKFKYVFRKGVRHSLHANRTGLFNSTFLCLQGTLLTFYKEQFTTEGVVDYSYIIILYILIYPLIIASFKLYKEVLETSIERYDLLVS